MTDTSTSETRMERWDQVSRPWVVVAAVLPLAMGLIVSDTRETLFIIVDLSSWAVFIVDLVARIRIDRRYLRTGSGIFDLSIILLTFPWYIFPFGDTAAFMSVFRLARLLRLFTATDIRSRSRRLFARLGRLGIALALVSLFAALIVLRAEPPESGYENLGDALWWATVSFTTVGYGDLFPTTNLGRFAGLLMMLTGLAALGTVSAVLSDSFRGDADEQADHDSVAISELLAEVKALRVEVSQLRLASGDTQDRDRDHDGGEEER